MLVPKLRFKREDGTEYPEWSNKSFANAFAPLNNNTFSRDMLSENGTVLNIHYGDILVKFGEVCDIKTADIPKVNADIETSKYDELQDGDIILADTAEDETVGKAIEIYRVGASKVISGLHTMACRPNDKYATKYMGYYINSPTYHNQLLPFMQGIKVTSIGRKNIADTVIYYPSDLEEQQKIANFLSTVDEVIAQSEAEVQNLEQQKKAAMQKIFSQEVRFKREDGTEYPEWGEKVISDLGTVITGNTPPTKNKENYGGDFLWVTPTDITDYPIINDTERKLTDIGKKKARILPKNTVLITCIASIGKNCILTQEGSCNQQINAIIPKTCISPFFLLNAINYKKHELEVLGGNGGMKIVSKSLFEQFSINIPADVEEQQKIADFLSAYDEAISYAKQELDKWKELKKGLLQQMFA